MLGDILDNLSIFDDDNSVMADDSLAVGHFLDVSELFDDFNVMFHELGEGPDDMSVVSETVFAHDMVQFVDHLVRMSGSVSDDRM